jgi:hypothetical protein
VYVEISIRAPEANRQLACTASLLMTYSFSVFWPRVRASVEAPDSGEVLVTSPSVSNQLACR